MKRFFRIAIGTLFLASASAQAGLECVSDKRPADGNLTKIEFVSGSTGTSIMLSAASSGMVGGGSTQVIKSVLTSKLSCFGSQLDQRIQQCNTPDWSSSAMVDLVIRSDLVVHGPNNVTHRMVSSWDIAVNANGAAHKFMFDESECQLKP